MERKINKSLKGRKSDIFGKLKSKILKILKKYEIRKAGIFGSFARGEETKNSDIDILIELEGKKSLFDLIEIEMELEKELNKKVDLLTYRGINPLLKKIILKEEIRII
ncbi:hypothetical protein CMI46_00740 [Candidatus Pacearchaeota archaeon]|nr:hypothetical protein [Candidatus Pacearchaeota archaeon]|tara:strand:+ start:53 stop:376 length:324 start_codon:yes stop_codon:yes gene_type:complete